MDVKMFQELVERVRQAGAIMRGETKPSREFVVDKPNVKAIRARFGVSQREFASLLGISVRTLENWEQKRRAPRVLLTVAETHPEVFLAMLERYGRLMREMKCVGGSVIDSSLA